MNDFPGRNMIRSILTSIFVYILISGFSVYPGVSTLLGEDEEYNFNAAVHISKANIMIREGKLKEAENELRMAVKEDPESEYLRIRLSDVLFQLEKYDDIIKLLGPPEEGAESMSPYLYLGLAYQYDGRMDEAIEAYEYIYNSDLATGQDLIHLGRILTFESRFEEAIRYFKKAGELLPGSVEVHTLLGESYIALENPEKAREEYEKIIEIEPGDVNNWLVLAQFAEDGERYEDALNYYGEGINRSENPSPLLQNILRISAKLGDYTRAIEITEALVDKFPENGPIIGMLGVLYYQVSDLEKANDTISRAMEKGVDSFQLNLTLGRSLMELDKSEDALEYLEKAVTLRPDEFAGWINLALANFAITKYDEALESIEKAELIKPESVQALYLKGVIMNRSERWVEALEPLEKVLALTADNKDVLFNLAIAHERLQQRDKAEELLLKIIEIDPDDSEVLNYLGYMWVEKGENIEEAGKMIERALELDPDNGYFIDSMAWVYYHKGVYEEALREILRSIELVQDDPVIFEHLGDIYRKLGQLDKTSEAWKKSLEIDPENQDLRKKLEEIQPQQ
jgi:tetratricopeptide (TPR) repeat protein